MKRVLQFLRLANRQGDLSLTNLLTWGAIAFVFQAAYRGHDLSLTDLGAFIVTIAAYRHKQGAGDVNAAA